MDQPLDLTPFDGHTKVLIVAGDQDQTVANVGANQLVTQLAIAGFPTPTCASRSCARTGSSSPTTCRCSATSRVRGRRSGPAPTASSRRSRSPVSCPSARARRRRSRRPHGATFLERGIYRRCRGFVRSLGSIMCFARWAPGAPTVTLSTPCGCGGTGRRAGFRSRWASALGGSTPLARI
jgi:hypothetical protein